ncbi:MAG: hypothetical protein AAF127_05465 [Pseudomonadota bacterium]
MDCAQGHDQAARLGLKGARGDALRSSEPAARRTQRLIDEGLTVSDDALFGALAKHGAGRYLVM